VKPGNCGQGTMAVQLGEAAKGKGKKSSGGAE
jgi:hypothetical protein